MIRAIALLCILGAGVQLLYQTADRLESFRREAEVRLGGAVKIEEVPGVEPALGLTYCFDHRALIRIQVGLEEALRDAVTSHELGHAVLCATGVRTIAQLTPAGIQGDTRGLLTGFLNEVASCYIDPVADAEASKRGFDPGVAVDRFLRTQESHPSGWISDSVAGFGDEWIKYAATNLYCMGLRPHTVSMQEVEKHFEVEPRVVAALKEYRTALGRPQCSDAIGCFDLTIRLRNAAGLRGLMVAQDPTTHSFE